MGVFQDTTSGDWYEGPDDQTQQDQQLLAQGIVRDPGSGEYFQIPRSSLGHWQPPPAPTPVPRQEDPDADNGVGIEDYARSVMAGGAQLVQGLGWLTRMTGSEDIGRSIEDLGRDAVDYWNEGLSDAAKDALSREFVRKNEAGEWEWGDANLNTVGLFGAQSLLGTAASAGAGASLTRVLQTFANPVGRSLLVRAAAAGSEQALKKLALVDKVIGATGFGIGEGATQGMSAGVNVYDRVMTMDPAKLMENERYQQVYNSTDDSMPELERHQYAADTVAREASSMAGLQSGLTGALLGAPMGAYLGSIFGKSAIGRMAENTAARRFATAAAGEGAQEFAQSAVDQLTQNRQLQQAGDDVGTWDDVLNQALGGAAAGLPIGGVLGASGHRADTTPPAAPKLTDEQLPPAVRPQALLTGPQAEPAPDFVVNPEGEARRPGETASERLALPAPRMSTEFEAGPNGARQLSEVEARQRNEQRAERETLGRQAMPRRHLEPLREAANAAKSKGADQEEILKVVRNVVDGNEPVLHGATKLRKMAQGAPAATLDKPAEKGEPRRLAKAVASGSEQQSILPNSGATVRTQYQLVDIDNLHTSHDIEGTVNPKFPQELQPRDRSRSASKQWIEQAAARFQAPQMIEGVSAGGGPPIVDADGIVESGNGRTNLLRRVYETGRGQAYRDYLRQNAGKFGLSPEQVDQVSKPVLVRVRQDPMTMAERMQFTKQANERPVAALSPAEQAKTDASAISDEDMVAFNADESGNVLAAGNQRFVNRFLASMPASERGALMTSDGQPTKQVADRIKAAVFSKAYGDDRLLSLMAEDADPDVRNVINALTMAAPAFAKAKAAGSTIEMTGPLVEGVEVLRKARKSGQAVDEYLRQQGLFSSISPEAGRFAAFMDKNIRSAKRMGEALAGIANYAETAAKAAQSRDMFGNAAPQTLEAAITETSRRMGEQQPGQPSLFVSDKSSYPAAGHVSVTDQIPDTVLFGGNPDLPSTSPDAPDYGRPTAPSDAPRNNIPSQLTQRQKAQLLAQMSTENRPIATRMMEGVMRAIGHRGTFSVSTKSEKSLLGKANRKNVLRKRPWWNAEHVADSFRFKAVLDDWADLPRVVEAMRGEMNAAGISLEKADFGKFWSSRGIDNEPGINAGNAATLEPVDAWGWRMVPFDLRMPNGQLAECYVTTRELNDAQQRVGHDIFEKWRFQDTQQVLGDGPEKINELLADMNLSRKTYDAAVRAHSARTGHTESALLASFSKAEALASGMGAKSFVRSSIAPTAEKSLDQLPPERNAANPSPNTTTVPEPSRASIATGVRSRSTAITSSDETIPHSAQGTPSDVQSRRHAYNAAQLSLEFPDGTSTRVAPGLQTRADTTDAATKDGLDALITLRDLRSGAAVLGNGIPKDFAGAGQLQLIGRTAKSTGEIAQLAQAYRDPRFETLRFIYVNKDGEVVHETGLTSRLPGAASFLMKGQSGEEAVRTVRMNMQAAGATGYYMLHNHPSGKSTPSMADERLTRHMEVEAPGFLGHVIIDHNEYSVLHPGSGESTSLPVDSSATYGADGPTVPHPLLGQVITGIRHLRDMAAQLLPAADTVTVIANSGNAGIRGIASFPLSTLKPGFRTTAMLRRFAINSGGTDLFAVVGKASHINALPKMFTDVAIADVGGIHTLHEIGEPDRLNRYARNLGRIDVPGRPVRNSVNDLREELYKAEKTVKNFMRAGADWIKPHVEQVRATHGNLTEDETAQKVVQRLAAKGDRSLVMRRLSSGLAADLGITEEEARQRVAASRPATGKLASITSASTDREIMAAINEALPPAVQELDTYLALRDQVALGGETGQRAQRMLDALEGKDPGDGVLRTEGGRRSLAVNEEASGYAQAEPDVQSILNRIMTKPPEAFTMRDRARQLWHKITDRTSLELKQGFIDSLASIEALERDANDGKLLDASLSAYKAALATKNLSSVMAAVMVKGIPVFKGGTYQPAENRKGVLDIFDPLTKHKDGNLLQQWEGYAVARRASRLKQEGRENLLSQQEIDSLLALGKKYPQFEQVFSEWQAFNKQALDMAEEAGVIDPEARKLWERNDYVPFYRVMEDAGDKSTGPSNRRGLAGQRSGIKTLKGGEQQLGNVFENMMLNTAHLLDASYKNRAMQRIVEMGAGTGAFDKVELPWEAVKVADSQMASALRNAGIDVASMDEQQREGFSTLFRKVAPRGNGIVSVMVDGKPQYYQINDPLLLNAVSGMGYDNFSDVLGLFRGSKKLLTHAVTADPAFMLANFVRDTLSNWVISDTSTRPITDAVKGLTATFKNDPALMQMMMAGAGGGGFYDSNPDEIRKLIAERVPEGQRRAFMDSIVGPKNAWQLWRKIGAAAENANRIATFRRVLEKGGTVAEAAYQARDVLNFSMAGDYAAMRWLTQSVPFMNARIQGLYRLYRGARDNKRAFFTKGLMLAAATMALALKNQDDDRYEELPEWDKDTYWHVFIGDEHYRIPKPFEVGAMFSTIPERLMRTASGSDSAKVLTQRMFQMFADTFAFNPVPQLVKPIIEQYANRSMFTGSPIVGMAEANLQPEAQYTPWTSETMRELAKAMPDFAPAWLRSPRRLEAALRAYTGSLGMYLLGASDAAVRSGLGYPEDPSRKIQDLPIVGRFWRDENPRHTKYADEMYSMMDEANATFSTVNRLTRERRFTEAAELRAENRDKLAARVRLNRMGTNVRNINNQIRLIQLDRNMDSDTKLERIDALVDRKNTITREVARFSDVF